MLVPVANVARARLEGLAIPPGPNGVTLALAPGAIHEGFRPRQRWTVPLPDSSERVLFVDRVRWAGDDLCEVRGHLEGLPGSRVLLTRSGNAVAVEMVRPSADPVLIAPMADGAHRMEIANARGAPRCAVDAPTAVSRATPRPGRRLDATMEGAASTVEATLDLAFFYTPTAETAAGGIQGLKALLQLAVMEANEAFEQSAARLRIRPVCRVLVAYQESGDISLDLDRFATPGDGWMDEVHDLRDAYAADIACLVTEAEDRNQYAGIANQLIATDSDSLARGFALCLRPYLVGNYTLPHEIGHLLGCTHDRENAAGPGLDLWSYGTRIDVGGRQYRTVMAYRPGLQFPHFSNPEVLFLGVPTGTANGPNAADNVRTLNATAPLIAAVRNPAARLGFSADNVDVSESAGLVRVPLEMMGSVTNGQAVLDTVQGSAVPATDFVASRTVLHFSSDAAAPTAEVVLIDNASVDGLRQFALELHDPSTGLSLGPISTATITIHDDEPEPVASIDTSFVSRPGADGQVTSLAVTPDHQVIVAGAFASFNGIPRSRIARLLGDGSVDETFKPVVKYRIDALALLPDGRLAIGGEFNTVDGVSLNHLALLRPGGSPDPSFLFDPGSDYPVEAILPSPDGAIFIGGSFTKVQGLNRPRVARVLPNGQPDPAFDPHGGPDDAVLSLAATAGDGLLIGGRFRFVDGWLRPGVARLKPNGRVDIEFRPPTDLDGPVYAVLADASDRVLIAGAFTNASGRSAGGIARLLASGASDPGFHTGSGANGAVLALLPGAEGALWIAGAFTTFDGQNRARVARLQPDGALDPTFDPGFGPDDWVAALAPGGEDSLVIGGLFDTVDGVARGRVSALLTGPLDFPRFLSTIQDPDSLQWEAMILPRQTYDLQESGDLRTWNDIGTLQMSWGPAWGRWPKAFPNAGFLRLKRRLE